MRRRWSVVRVGTCACAIAAVVSCEAGEESTSTDVAPRDTIVAVQVTVLGEFEGPEEYVFGDITSVAVGPLGQVYVADRLGSTVRAFDMSGRFIGMIGEEGEGPGEFFGPVT